jgi:2Fe-2S ferredoxin
LAKITYVQPDGARRTVDVADAVNLMFGALQNGIPGIVGACGGAMACATCHVYVDAEWLERVGPPGDEENGMLDVAAAECRPTSRLSCQIEAAPDLDGLVVHIPDAQ